MAIPWLLSAQQLDPDPIPVRSQQLQKATQPTHISVHYVTLHAKPRNLQRSKPVVTVVAQAYLSDLV